MRLRTPRLSAACAPVGQALQACGTVTVVARLTAFRRLPQHLTLRVGRDRDGPAVAPPGAGRRLLKEIAFIPRSKAGHPQPGDATQERLEGPQVTSRSPSRSTSTGSTTDAFTARSVSSCPPRSSPTTGPPAAPSTSLRQPHSSRADQVISPPRDPGRFTSPDGGFTKPNSPTPSTGMLDWLPPLTAAAPSGPAEQLLGRDGAYGCQLVCF
jgi:hypothetical protein